MFSKRSVETLRLIMITYTTRVDGRYVLIRTWVIRSANSAVSIRMYIFLTYIYISSTCCFEVKFCLIDQVRITREVSRFMIDTRSTGSPCKILKRYFSKLYFGRKLCQWTSFYHVLPTQVPITLHVPLFYTCCNNYIGPIHQTEKFPMKNFN